MADAIPFSEITREPLDTVLVGQRIITFDTIDSTNEYALRHGRHGYVYIADSQTMGRGRQGRSWHSAPGLGLWFTVAFEEAIDGLTFASALAVRDALTPRCKPKIKWPNDILLNAKKICGILSERRGDITALGIGINVHHRRIDFPEELRDIAGSLRSETSLVWERAHVLNDILTHLDRNVMLLRSGKFEQIRATWADACDLIGRRIRCGMRTGIVTEIDLQGAVILDTPEGQHRIIAEDITVLDGA